MPGKHHDLVNNTKKFKGELQEVFLDMKHWRSFKTRYRLSWKRVKFGVSTHSQVPMERGIYSFVAELDSEKLPQHGYILYVGITGDGASSAHLNQRYGQYIKHLENEDGRPAVFYMLKNWSEDLYFHYVELPDRRVDLARIERALLNAIIPPINKRDISAEITAVRAATF